MRSALWVEPEALLKNPIGVGIDIDTDPDADGQEKFRAARNQRRTKYLIAHHGLAEPEI